jgi:hypothetical protein
MHLCVGMKWKSSSLQLTGYKLMEELRERYYVFGLNKLMNNFLE